MTALWWVLAATAAGVTTWGLADAVRDLIARPGFDGVLRLVVETVAGAVVVGYCVSRARRTPAAADDGGGNRAGGGQDRQDDQRQWH